MTSSLVGSEMCIRDSGTAGPAFGPPLPLVPNHVEMIPRGAVERSLNPVSYTHLTLPTICSV
eukprot:1819112-Prorocentrum_lima.AAC.1